MTGRRKQAVDSKAEAYWADYFGDYGRIWTRKIPRRVTSALQGKLGRTAGKLAAMQVVSSVVTPLSERSWAPRPDGGLTFEGLFSAEVDIGGRRARVLRAFCADFTPDGRMVGLKTTTAA